MPRLNAIIRFIHISTAAAAFLGAAALIITAGLPDRATSNALYLANGLPVAPEIGGIAPPFTALLLSGDHFDLTQLPGTSAIINFWATWCAPCEAEMPALQALYQANRQQGLRVLAVNMGEPPEVIRPWLAERGLTFDVILDPNGDIAALYHLLGQPSTFILNDQHIITSIFYGPAPLDALQRAITLAQ